MVRGGLRGSRGRSVAALACAGLALVALAGCASRGQLIYRRAEIFFGRGDYEMAMTEYERITEDHASDPVADDALYKLGHLYRVHLKQPGRALTAYRRLAQDYPSSSYADDALLWCVHIWARDFKSPSQAAEPCAELDRRYPDRPRLRARAHLEIARAQVAAGHPEEARAEIELVQREFSAQAELAGRASLMLAELAEAKATKKEEVAALLDAVIEKYPDTLAAEEARHRLGLLYYEARVQDEKQRVEEMKREACWLANVPAFERRHDPRLTMLDALGSLLRHSGCQVSLPVLALLARRALLPVAEIGREAWPVLWEQDPLAGVAETCGMAPSVWVAQRKEEAWDAARRALSRGQPCLVAYGGKDGWMILAGWRPQQQQVGVLEAGSGRLRALPLQQLLAGWDTASKAAPFIAFPGGAYYVLTVSGRRKAVDEAALRQAAMKTLSDLVGGGQEVGLSRPVDIAREAALLLSRASGNKRPVPTEWADTRLRRWAEVRRVLADALQPVDPERAQAARHIADVVGSLRDALRSAESGDAPERDYQAAASSADRLAVEEDNFAQSLAELAEMGGR